jgi:HEAT repeat protein
MSVDLESADSTRLLALLGDPDPAVREQAGVALLNREDAESSLVRGLGDDYLGTRIAALSLLKKMGAPDLAFDPWATTDQRTADLDKWHEWVAQRKSPAGAAEQPSP